MESNGFDFNTLIADSKKALLKPEEYFSSMSTEGSLGTPIIKALIYGAVAGVIYFIWSLLGIGAVGGMGGLVGGAVGIMAIIGSIIGALIGLFIGAVIILILCAIANGKTEFEPIVHVSSSLLVIMPVSAVASFFSVIHPILGSLLVLAVNMYFLYMLFFAMTKTLNAKADVSKIIMFIFAGLLILFFFIGILATRATRSYMRDWNNIELSSEADRKLQIKNGDAFYGDYS